MVECGANGVTEAEVLDALDIAHEEIKKICACIEELRAKAGKEKLEVEEPKIDPELVERIRSSHGAKLDEATQIPEKLARQEAAKAVEEEVLEQYASGSDGEDADPSSAPRSRAPSTSSRRRSSAAGSRSTRSGPTGAPRTRSGRSSARWTSRPACTARRCSPAGRRRSSPTWRWARAAWTCGSTTSAWSSRRPSGTTTTSRRSRSGRPASCAARSAATSATARSPSERWCRRSRARTTSPTWFGSSRRRWSRTGPRRWARSAPRRWR